MTPEEIESNNIILPPKPKVKLKPIILPPEKNDSKDKIVPIIVIIITIVGLTIGGGLFLFLSSIKRPQAENIITSGTIFTNTPIENAANTKTITPTVEIITLSSASLSLGDKKYSTSGAQKGLIYTCDSNFSGAGASKDGNWIVGNMWDPTKKIHVEGNIPWPDARITFSKKLSTRVITTNNLPTTHNSGIFPISIQDPAYQYDKNPNSILPQSFQISLPLNPIFGQKSQCVKGSVGIMLNGVVLFDGLDAIGRDAMAHEVQDKCGGHPEKSGSYHYHGPSDCISDIQTNKLIGYAWDGFGIYGSKDSNGKELTTADLDECHGITSEIVWEEKTVKMYHYVMTKDYPYSVGCFKGNKVSREISQ